MKNKTSDLFRKFKKGFTLVELIIVIVIIGVLAAVLIPSLTGYITKAKNSNDLSIVTSLNQAMEIDNIEEELNFYSPQDLSKYLEEKNLTNLKVNNKKNLIVFDKATKKFEIMENYEDQALVENPYFVAGLYQNKYIVSNNGNSLSNLIGELNSLDSTNIDSADLVKSVNAIKNKDLRTKVVNILEKTYFLTSTGELKSINTANMKKTAATDKDRVVVLNDVETLALDNVATKSVTLVVPTFITNATISQNITIGAEFKVRGNIKVFTEEVRTIIGLTRFDSNPKYDDMNNNNVTKEEWKIVTTEEELRNAVIDNYKTIVIGKSFTITKSLNVPYGINILLPYEKTNDKENQGYKFYRRPQKIGKNGLDDYFENEQYGSILSVVCGEKKLVDLNVPIGGETKYLNNDAVLTIKKGVNITLGGNLVVGGLCGCGLQGLQAQTSGKYAQINLDGTINVLDGGILNVYGYIKTTDNGKIEVSKNGVIKEPLVIGDYKGGSKTMIYANPDDPQIPFMEYALPNVQVETIIKQGNLVCKTMLNTGEKLGLPANQNYIEINFIGLSDSNPFIVLNEETNITMNYNKNNILNNNPSDIDHCGTNEITINGGASLNYLQFELKTSYATIKIDSSTMILPLPFTLNIRLENGSYDLNGKYALLPGARMTVEKDAILNLNENSEFYAMNYLTQEGLKKHGFEYLLCIENMLEEKYENANYTSKFIVDGTFNIKDRSTFGGIINSLCNDAIINVESLAVLSNSIELGISNGSTIGDIAYRTKYQMDAKLLCNNNLINLEKNCSYKSVNSNEKNVTAENVFYYEYVDKVEVDATSETQKKWNSEFLINDYPTSLEPSFTFISVVPKEHLLYLSITDLFNQQIKFNNIFNIFNEDSYIKETYMNSNKWNEVENIKADFNKRYNDLKNLYTHLNASQEQFMLEIENTDKEYNAAVEALTKEWELIIDNTNCIKDTLKKFVKNNTSFIDSLKKADFSYLTISSAFYEKGKQEEFINELTEKYITKYDLLDKSLKENIQCLRNFDRDGAIIKVQNKYIELYRNKIDFLSKTNELLESYFNAINNVEHYFIKEGLKLQEKNIEAEILVQGSWLKVTK